MYTGYCIYLHIYIHKQTLTRQYYNHFRATRMLVRAAAKLCYRRATTHLPTAIGSCQHWDTS